MVEYGRLYGEKARQDEPVWFSIVTRFYRLLDAGDAAGMGALVHPDFVWLRMGNEVRAHQIASAVAQRDARLRVYHLVTGLVFEATVEDHVHYSGYLLVVRANETSSDATRLPPSGMQALHVCEGELRRNSDTWQLSAMNAGAPRVVIDL